MAAILSDRQSAAFRLTDRLWHLRGVDALLMAVDRGGVAIGSVLARLLGFPLEFLAETEDWFGERTEEEAELVAPSSARKGQTLIVVDDGMATETRLAAALRIARARQPTLLVLALPAALPATTARLRTMADAVIYLQSPTHSQAVEECYEKLPPVTDAEVAEAMRAANA
ncbi:phosphoribosyltransferase family protein [Hymenobacter radiodurans]|uniref:phosphoribosyltransferase family protein n=1 Tax=Hymenobacter radiodurans TaxID=2496028 RepID=UPI001058EAB5|nr:phosphoribosyltransferase family protein [Hymenobacter radiodurans]